MTDALNYRNIGPVIHNELGYFCLLPGDKVGAFVLLKHPESLVGEVSRAVKVMPHRGKALVFGGHIGTIVVPLSTHCSELVALEPNPRAFEMLQLNVAMNGCENVVLANFAANDKEEMLDFVVQYANSGGSGRTAVHDVAWQKEEGNESKIEHIQVPAAPLDKALSDYRFDLVFMDCEGSEYFAFLGMQRILSEAQALIVEWAPSFLQDVAGVTIEEWLRPLLPHFSRLYIPTTGRKATDDEILPLLQSMSAVEQTDSGIIFRKA